MEIPYFPQRTGLGPVRKSFRKIDLRNGISLGVRKQHIRIGSHLCFVDGVMWNRVGPKFAKSEKGGNPCKQGL